MAAIIKESVIAGPVYDAATVPVMENNPAPIITPTPRATRLTGPSTRLRVPLPVSLASACKASILFRIKSPISLSVFYCPTKVGKITEYLISDIV